MDIRPAAIIIKIVTLRVICRRHDFASLAMTIKALFKIIKFIKYLPPVLYLLSARVAFAIETGLGKTAETAGLGKDPKDITILIGDLIKALLGLVGIAFFVLMLYGGFTWMKARGNEKDVESAKTTITNAIIGLIIVAAAYAITGEIIRILSKP